MDPGTFLRLLLDWLPFLIFIGILLLFARKSLPRQKNHMDASQKYMSEHLAEVKKMNETLARIAAALERRDR